MTKKIIIIQLIASIICCNYSYGQNTCKIYKVVVDTIYSNISTAYIYPNQKYPIDPEKPQIDTSSKKIIHQDFIVNLKSSLLFDSYRVKKWFAYSIHDSTLIREKYYKPSDSLSSSSLTCLRNQSKYCSNILSENNENVDYDSLHHCLLNNKKSLLYNITIDLSQILFYDSNRKAILYANCYTGKNLSDESTWYVELFLNKNKWQIKRLFAVQK